MLSIAALGVALLWRRAGPGPIWLMRATLYVAAVVAVYLDHGTPTRPWPMTATQWLVVPLLAASTVTALRLSGDRRFETTPLDLLLIFGALALPNLPGLEHAPRHLGLSVAELVALCYAIELVSAVGARLRSALVASALGFFLVIAFRAYFQVQ